MNKYRLYIFLMVLSIFSCFGALVYAAISGTSDTSWNGPHNGGSQSLIVGYGGWDDSYGCVTAGPGGSKEPPPPDDDDTIYTYPGGGGNGGGSSSASTGGQGGA